MYVFHLIKFDWFYCFICHEGYLKEENYMKTYRIFLKECNHLREYEALLRSGAEYPTAIMGLTLLMMLQEYAQLKLNGKIYNSTGKDAWEGENSQ